MVVLVCDSLGVGATHKRVVPLERLDRRLPDRASFADLGATVADLFGVPPV